MVFGGVKWVIMMVVVRAEMVKVEGEEEENEEDGGDKSEGEVEHFSKEGLCGWWWFYNKVVL